MIDDKVSTILQSSDPLHFYDDLTALAIKTCQDMLPPVEVTEISKGWFKAKKEHLSAILRTEQHTYKAWRDTDDAYFEQKTANRLAYMVAHHTAKDELRIARGEFWNSISESLEKAFNMNDQSAFNRLAKATHSYKRLANQHG